MKVLCFGSCNIDYVYSVSHIVRPGETISAGSMEQFPGGKGLNQSVALAKAGAEVYHAGCVGNDGQMLIKILSEYGVNTSYVKTVDTKTGQAIIQVDDNGENSIFIYHGANIMITEEYINEVLSDFSSGDIILLQNEISNLRYILKKAAEKKMKIIWNPAPFDDSLRDIDLSDISMLILNEVEGAGFSGETEPDKCLSYFCEKYPEMIVVLTLGKKGCVYSDGNEIITHPAYEVDAVDTTAAGDTFIGYFTAAFSEEKPITDALKQASAAAAVTVSRMGAASSIPTLCETEKALKELSFYDSKKTETISEQKRSIMLYIKENIENACLDDLSERLGYSKSYISYWIQKNMNDSFSGLLQKERCRIASKLLIETSLPVREIINRVGYTNESFFRKAFRKAYGKSLLEYRKFYQK